MGDMSADGFWQIPNGRGGWYVGFDNGMVTITPETWERMWQAEHTLKKTDRGATALVLAELDKLRVRVALLVDQGSP